MQSNRHSGTPPDFAPAHLPVLLLALALVAWFSFQLSLAAKTREALAQAVAAQQPQVDNANRIKQALFGLAVATKRLALQGNPNAAQVVGNLAGRGIKIDDPPPGEVLQTLQN